MKARAWSSVVGGALCVAFVGCSATKGGTGVEGGGASSTGSTSNSGGLNLAGTVGTAGMISIGGDVTANGGMEMGCNDLSVETKEVTPTVLLLVDNSSSMFEPRDKLWDPLYNTLMKPTDGIVASLQDKVRFGFTSYRGSSTKDDPACPNMFEVDYKLNNYEPI